MTPMEGQIARTISSGRVPGSSPARKDAAVPRTTYSANMAVTDGGGEGGAGLADMDVARAESTLDFAGLMMIVYKSVL